jgi:hypothetical protein
MAVDQVTEPGQFASVATVSTSKMTVSRTGTDRNGMSETKPSGRALKMKVSRMIW